MSIQKIEKLCILVVCSVVSVFVGALFYDDFRVAVIFIIPMYILLKNRYRKLKRKRYEKRFSYQFEEMLESLAVALQTGYSLENALFEVKKQLMFMYGYETEVIHELDIICRGIKVNIPVEKLMRDMALRVKIHAVTEYAHVLETAKRYGGNLIEITKQNMNMLRDKRMVLDEIEAMTTGKKCESAVMNIMPIAILLYLKLTSYGMIKVLYSNVIGNVIMTILLGGYIATVMLGNYITDFEKNSVHAKKETLVRKKKCTYPVIMKRLKRTFLNGYIDSVNRKIALLCNGSDREQTVNCFWMEFCKRLVVANVCAAILILCAFICDRSNVCIYIVIATVLVVGVPYMMISKINRRIDLRSNQLEVDYPELVDRLILFIGAGLSMKGCFIKIAEEYEKAVKIRKEEFRYLYEEIVYMSHQLKNGVTESVVYEAFGKRCAGLAYMRLTTMLTRNLKKGNADMLGKLRMTSIDAFESRKIIMKKLGEKASSKLLLPMMLQFVIILVIIMYPAMIMSR